MRLGRLRSTPSRPLILLSPYKFGATKSLYSFRAPGTRAVKRDITGAISRPGNTLAVWPDRVTILTIRDIRLKHHRLVNQSSLSATARKPPSISSPPSIHSSRRIAIDRIKTSDRELCAPLFLENVTLSLSLSIHLAISNVRIAFSLISKIMVGS